MYPQLLRYHRSVTTSIRYRPIWAKWTLGSVNEVVRNSLLITIASKNMSFIFVRLLVPQWERSVWWECPSCATVRNVRSFYADNPLNWWSQVSSPKKLLSHADFHRAIGTITSLQAIRFKQIFLNKSIITCCLALYGTVSSERRDTCHTAAIFL